MKGAKAWAVVSAFWVFVTLLYVGQIVWLSRMPGEQIDLRAALAWQTTYYLLWIPLTLLVWRLTADWIPDAPRDWARIVLRHLPLVVAISLVHFACVALLSRLLHVAMVPGLWPSMVAQMRGRLHLELLIYTAAAATGAVLGLHDRYRDRQLAALKLEGELAAARLDALRTQLQPHFLFNSLHSIASLARAGDTAGVVRLIAGFSELLRSLLEQEERYLPLADELQLVERYLEIQRVRFADRLQTSIDAEPAVTRARVPLLVVQPLVENALRHGLGPRVAPGTLAVRASREDGWTRIDVEDTGLGLPSGWTLASTRGTGLRNLAARLTGEFGASCSLDVVPREGGGVVATVRIPYAAM
jgi:signal transduction histidine kinase